MADQRRYPVPGSRRRTKVLYVGGTGRTGSTLVSRVLGQLDGWFSAGELAFLWRYGLAAGGRCSCSRPIGACDVWRSALARAAEEVELDAERMVRLRRRFWSVHLPLMVSGRMRRRGLDRLEEFPATVEAVYHAIGETRGTKVIVDSSKEPHYSYILRERTDLDVYFLHLVRDPRAVGYSWQRRRRELGLAGDGEMERRGPLKASVYYDVSNVAAEALWRGTPDRYRLIRYEDFVRDPEKMLEAVAEFVGEPAVGCSVLSAGAFDPVDEHMAWGNPNRFGAGPVTIASDTSWRTGLGRWDSSVLTGLSGALGWRYGYPLRPTGEARPRPRGARLADATLPRS